MYRNLLRMNLQLFAGESPEPVATSGEEDVTDPVIVDDEGSDLPNPPQKQQVQESADDMQDDAPEDVDGDDAPEPGTEESTQEPQERRKVSFSPEQQKVVNEIVNNRLKKFEAEQLKFLSRQAGAQLTSEDLSGAARLWGLLMNNQDLSIAVDNLIQQYLSEGRATPPNTSDVSTKEQELAVKEAILDLKESDKLFRSKADEILEWAEDQGFEITDKKSLKLAYMAWKGANESLLRANDALREQRKQALKQQQKRRAAVEAGSRGASRPSTADYRKMDDREVLEAEGLSLFIDE